MRRPGRGDEWDHLTDAIDLYTRACVERRLEQMRERTAATREALLPPTSPLRQQPQPDSASRQPAAHPEIATRRSPSRMPLVPPRLPGCLESEVGPAGLAFT
ncbi:hypothetical protein ACWCXB_28370 [Streptomyces sp. NPDC001514]